MSTEIKNTFIGGKMNHDLDPLLTPKGQYFYGLNIEVSNPENQSDALQFSDSGTLRNVVGNKIPLNNLGTPLTIVDINGLPLVNARCIGTCVAGELNSIFFIITSTNEDLIVQYTDTPSVSPVGTVGAVSYVLRAPKPTVGNRYLNLNSSYYATGFNYMDNFLMWTDNLNPPRMINVTTFKQYTQTNFAWDQDDINVIVKPSLGAAVITLSNDGTPKNEIKNKFLYFSYRWKYTDNRWSTFAPFTQVAFTPASFAFNGQNVTSMYNIYNKVAITVATGDRQVTDIQFLFKDSEFSNIYVIETVNKLKPIVGVPVIPDNSIWTYPAFDNSKTYASLPSYELTRLFDNVPLKALAQDIVGSRLTYGEYTQFYNMKTVWNSKIIANFTVQAISAPLAIDQYRPSLKTNNDYEFGIVYTDDHGRMSTPITSVTNTVHISAQNAGRQNYVRININHYPPYWATKYRLFIKQSRPVYYNVFPSRIEIPTDEAGVSYYLLNPVDKDKIKEGDSVLQKTDFSGVTGSTTEYSVLEVEYKDAEAINPTSPAGLYFKLAKTADPSIVNNLVYELLLSATLPALKAVIQTVAPLIINSWVDPASTIPSSWSPVVYYPGTLAALVLPNGNTPYRLAGNALAIFSHVAYSPVDLRYRLEYAGIVSGFHCLNYRKFDSPTNINTAPLPFRNAATNAPVLVTIKNPANVITLGQLYFSPLIQVFTGDTWRLNLYSNQNGITIGGNQIKPIAIVAPITTSNIIQGGSTIKFGTIFDGAAPLNGPGGINYNTPKQSFVSPMTYPDLQEWFWESGAYQEFRQNGATQNEHKNVFFRYGVSIQLPGLNVHMIQKQGNQVGAPTSPYEPIMLIGSAHTVFNTPLYLWNMRMDFFRIFYTEFPLCFEVYPANQRDPLFHECTENLQIITSNNKKYHAGYNPLGGGPVQNQNDVQGAVVFLNPGPTITSSSNVSFNCWSFYNGVELNRIGDIYNKPTTEWSPRVMIPSLDYGEQTVNGLTYSGTYRFDSNENNLNAFNLSLGNFKYLEKSFGTVQKIKSRDTDLVVFQQDQVSKVLYGKNLLSDAVGGGDVTSVPEVLGTQISYEGEYGISNNPESFAQWGDDMYFTDSQRGAVLRLDNQGLFDITNYGMKSFFNINFKLQPNTIKVGVFDPFYKRYILAETGFVKEQVPVITQIVPGVIPPNAYAYVALINNVLLVQ